MPAPNKTRKISIQWLPALKVRIALPHTSYANGGSAVVAAMASPVIAAAGVGPPSEEEYSLSIRTLSKSGANVENVRLPSFVEITIAENAGFTV